MRTLRKKSPGQVEWNGGSTKSQSQNYPSTAIEKYSSTSVHFPKVVGWYYSTLFHVRTKDAAILPDRPPQQHTRPTAANLRTVVPHAVETYMEQILHYGAKLSISCNIR